MVAVLVATSACRTSPARKPLSEPAGAGAVPDASAPASNRAPPVQTGRVLADLDGTAVVALDFPGFAELSREDRAAAAGLAYAAERAFVPALDSAYRKNVEIARLLRGILTHPDVAPAPVLARVRAYARLFWLNGGIHDAVTGRKVLPSFSLSQLRAVALAAQAAGADLGFRTSRLELGLRALEGPLFDPQVDALRVARPKDRDPLAASSTNLYDGITARELEGVQERAPASTRLVREGGRAVERPVDLGRVADALDVLAQRPELLIGFLRTGDPERFRAVERMWVTAAGAVESAFGFFDTSADPRGRKGLFGGVVGVPDPSVPPAPALEAAIPQLRAAPAPASLSPLVLLGSGGAQRPLRAPALTLGEGTPQRRTLLFASAESAAGKAVGEQIARELAPPELRDDFARCWAQVRMAQAALRELAAGSGPLATLGYDGPAAARARADAAAHALAQEPQARPLFQDARCQELYPQIVAASWLLAAGDAPEDGRLDAHELRALRFETFWFSGRGALSERRNGSRRSLHADPARFAEAAFELVKLLDQLERDGDPARVASLFAEHGSRADLGWRDEMVERFRSRPRRSAVLPPRLEPLTLDGKIVDARAFPIPDLDEEVLRTLAYVE